MVIDAKEGGPIAALSYCYVFRTCFNEAGLVTPRR